MLYRREHGEDLCDPLALSNERLALGACRIIETWFGVKRIAVCTEERDAGSLRQVAPTPKDLTASAWHTFWWFKR